MNCSICKSVIESIDVSSKKMAWSETRELVNVAPTELEERCSNPNCPSNNKLIRNIDRELEKIYGVKIEKKPMPDFKLRGLK